MLKYGKHAEKRECPQLKRERLKWTAGFLLCLCCFVFCVALAAPTRAQTADEEAGLVLLEEPGLMAFVDEQVNAQAAQAAAEEQSQTEAQTGETDTTAQTTASGETSTDAESTTAGETQSTDEETTTDGETQSTDEETTADGETQSTGEETTAEGETGSTEEETGSEPTSDSFFNGGEDFDPIPDTGPAANPALLLCMAALAMGGCYCGWRAFRHRRA